MTTHTPGPWTVFDLEVERATYGIDGADGSAVVFFGSNKTEGIRSLADARLIAEAPELLAEVERQYTELADITNEWPGRNTSSGQQRLCRLRGLIARATGRDPQDVQDDYGTRAATTGATP